MYIKFGTDNRNSKYNLKIVINKGHINNYCSIL